MAKFCANCGSPLDGAPKFCPSCGAQVMQEAAQETPTPPAVQPTDRPQPVRQEMNQPPMQRQMPQPPMRQEPPGQPQPMMGRNALGQNFGQQPFGAQPPHGGPNAAYGMGMMGAQAFNGEHYVPDEGLVQMFLRYDNRLNRKRYIMRALALVFAVTVLATVLGIVLAVVGMDEAAIGMMGTLIGLAGAIPGLMLAVRRLHDLDRPTWWIIGNFIPIVNVAFSLYLLLAKGTDGPNQFGPDPLEGQY